MEAFDISNTAGLLSVGSMIVYEKGRPKRNDYRKFKIKTVVGPDDYSSMREVLMRRFVHGMEEKKILEQGDMDFGKFSNFPELILILDSSSIVIVSSNKRPLACTAILNIFFFLFITI